MGHLSRLMGSHFSLAGSFASSGAEFWILKMMGFGKGNVFSKYEDSLAIYPGV